MTSITLPSKDKMTYYRKEAYEDGRQESKTSIKEETGETFINYVTDRRLEKGRLMLCETELSIKEISAEIGYNDQNYFSRIFKNKFGISPTDFRNTNRNSESL